ncbi:biotin--[acetyl-CoA-carboxylase] ligase [Tepidibacillus marianensis]|uniref:biotin--[acetyl-CoA-carboxylase] ligase n=1 Tax=Tepidibacillus marianensis TaxID=3131995 RepID=UPI0030CCD299
MKLDDYNQMSNIPTKWFGHNYYYYREIGSTNHVAKELDEMYEPEGTVIIAEQQTEGEGRLGRKWLSQGEGLWFSVILRPKRDSADAPQITLLAAVAVAEAIKNKTNLTPGIKWPNDILINGRKVCGILTELNANEDDYSIILGIGINVNLSLEDLGDQLQDTATSLSLELGSNMNRMELLKEVLIQLEEWYLKWQKSGFKPIRQAWKNHNITIGEKVMISSLQEKFHGEALDIDDTGALILRDDEGEMKNFNFGEVSLRNKE